MASERQMTRFYCDVPVGYDPTMVQWQCCPPGSVPPELHRDHKRIWAEYEMPSDFDLFPERFRGFEIQPLGTRQLIIDSPTEEEIENQDRRDRDRRRRPSRKVSVAEEARPE